MRASELVGKYAIRTKGANGDMSLTSDICKILYADDEHIVYELFFAGGVRQSILNSLFCDDNWKDATEIKKLCKSEQNFCESLCSTNENVERRITLYLLNAGIKRNLSGFDYLRKAIAIAFEDSDNHFRKITDLYSRVAKESNSSPQRVERSIRHSIECSGKKIINSQFIADAVDDIRLNMEEHLNVQD